MILNQKNEFELTDAERSAFKKLGDSKDFKIFQKSIQDYISLLLKQFLDGTESAKGSAGEEFYKLKNFNYYWKKFVKLTEKQDEKTQ